MSLSVAIVGLPNVGKSTLFNALLKRQAALAANYPFATIEPNIGIVPVPDERLNLLAQAVAKEETKTTTTLLKTKATTPNLPPIKPATVEFVDIAGLVEGASRGEGLGNKFLANIRETNLIIHVLRAFTAPDIIREGAKNPKDDLSVVRLELMLADLNTLQKQKFPKGSKDKKALLRWQVIETFKLILNKQEMLRFFIDKVTDKEKQVLMNRVAQELGLLTAKPELLLLNVAETDLVKGLSRLRREFASEIGENEDRLLVMSNQIESELSALDETDQKLYLGDLGLETSGLSRLIQAAYQTLGLQSFLTAGEKEVRAWTIPIGATAKEAAGVIHSDFTKKFIKAQVINWQEFIKLGGWKQAKLAGKVRQEGKDYLMQAGDLVEFIIGS